MLHVLAKAKTLLNPRYRGDLAILLLLCALAVLSWLPRLRGPIDLRWDGGAYYILGTSLAQGKGYRLLSEPGEIQTTLHPPILPVMVSAHQWLLGTSDPTFVGHKLRLSFFLLFVLYILAVYLMLRLHLPLRYAFLATLVCFLNVHTYFLSDLLFAEIPFGLATTLFVLCHSMNSRRVYGVLAALFAIVSYGLRTIGVAMFAAWVGESLLNRQIKKAALRLTLSLVPILCWQSYVSLVENGPEYNDPAYEYQRADYMYFNVSYPQNIFRLKDPFSPELGPASLEDIASRFLDNLTEIPASLGAAVSSTKVYWEMHRQSFNRIMPFRLLPRWVVPFTLLVLGCVALGGVALQLATRQWLIPIYILLYITAICLTPFPQQFDRYLAPLAPFIALSLFKMFLTIRAQSRKILPVKWKAAASIFMAAIVFLILVEQSLSAYKNHTQYHLPVVYNDQKGNRVEYRLFFYESYRSLDIGLDWLKLRARPNEIVAAQDPQWVYLRTGLKAVLPPFELDVEKKQRLLDTVPVSYLILDEAAFYTKKYTSSIVESYPDRWERIFSTASGNLKIYRRVGR